MNDKAREAFEAWAIEQPRVASEEDCFARSPYGAKSYEYGVVESLWLSWQAALQWAASQQAAPGGWISVNERLPAPWKDVDIALSNGRVHCGTYCGRDLRCFDWPGDDDENGDEYVTHWRDRPTAPTAQGERDEQ